MPHLGSIMTIAVDSATTANGTSVLEENMTWSRPAGEATSSTSYEGRANGEQVRAVGGSSDPSNEKHIETGVTTGATATVEEAATTGTRRISRRRCGLRTSGTRVCDIFESAEDAGSADSTTDDGASTSNSSAEVDEYGKDLLLFGFGDIMEDTAGAFNDSSNASLPRVHPQWNVSMYNETFIVVGEGGYPSGYTVPEIILASIVATLLMIVIIVGNMLVIIAIATEKALKNIQNWFIASLAVADFFLGLVIMPFSLANEIMGYWIFGYWWCDIYSAMDVLLCTASIMNLCLISLDRFWSITQAVDYLKKRTPARAALMIALVWLLSALVCIPPLLGWKRPTPEEEYPKCK
ncbi:PREDICTED: tyramine/octopamine receptor-like, partial [Dinoponera quadriceps]|uniref:Tyramine/octopamine receptor-like n=1 Tax=Dinoponera quadriceps TaxID=609295 RepID=A0A6P3XBG3_DINQU